MPINNSGSIKNNIDALRLESDNISKQNVNGAKGQEIVFQSFMSGDQSIVTTTTRNTLYRAGAIKLTPDQPMNIALNGPDGLIPVRGRDGETILTRGGTFDIGSDSIYRSSDAALLGYKLGADGVALSSTLETFSPIAMSPAKATSVVSPNINLKATNPALQGPGYQIRPTQSDVNRGVGNDQILMPDYVAGSSSLDQGTRFNVTAGDGEPRTFEYGGITVSKSIKIGNGFYGSKDQGNQFDVLPVGAAPGPNQLRSGDGLRVTVNGQTYDIKATPHNASIADKEFSSLTTLKQVLATIGLYAEIRNDRLVVAPKDGNIAVQFADLGGSNMVETLGLTDILAVAAAGVKRFSTLTQLRNICNSDTTLSKIRAQLTSNGTILNLGADSATSTIDMTGTSEAKVPISYIQIGTGNNDRLVQERERATACITSPKHNLQSGDLIRLSDVAGVNAQLPDGLYIAQRINDDVFSVSLINNAPAAFPIVGAAPGGRPVAGGIIGTWQRVAGSVGAALNAANVPYYGGGTVRIPLAAAHGLVAADVIYVSGIGAVQNVLDNAGGNANTCVVPDGYYVIQAVDQDGANNCTITPTHLNAMAPVGLPALPNVQAAGVAVQKIGHANGGLFLAGAAGGNFDTMVMVGVNGQQRAILNLTDHNYSVGDYISFTELPAAGAVFDGLTIVNDHLYRVAATTQHTVTFETDQVANAAVGTMYATPNGASWDFRINKFTRTAEYLNLPQSDARKDATYSANDENLNLASGKHNQDIFTHTISVYDSLGSEHKIKLLFGRLTSNKWATEVTLVPNSDGTYDAAEGMANGVLQAGTLEFDDQGRFFAAGDLTNQIVISWNNGSAASSIQFNWGDENAETIAGMTQFASSNNVIKVSQDGCKAGALQDLKVEPNGTIMGIYDNNMIVPLFSIPVATVTAYNNLTPQGSGYISNDEQVIFKTAGENGVPSIIGGAVETANIDPLNSLLQLQSFSQSASAAISAAQIRSQTESKAVERIV